MRFSCEKCSAKYTIADEKVRGKIVAVKCNKCGNKITVNGKDLLPPEPVAPEPKPLEESTRMVSLEAIEALRQGAKADEPKLAPPPVVAVEPPPRSVPSIGDDWYAMVNGQQAGPLTGGEVAEHLSSKKITANTYVWRDGMGDWKKAADVAELASALERSAPAKPKVVPTPPRPPPPSPDEEESPDVNATMVAPAGMAQRLVAEAQARARGPSVLDDLDSEDTAGTGSPGASEREREAPPIAAAAEEPGAPRGGGSSSGPLDSSDLFDSEMNQTMTNAKPIDIAALVAKEMEKKGKKPAFVPPSAGAPKPQNGANGARANGVVADPFAAVPDNPTVSKPNEIGETTQFFIKQSGAANRNPWWKIALFVVGFPGGIVGVLFLLSHLRIVPLEFKTVDAETGQEITTSLFSSGGMDSLRKKMLGIKDPPPAPDPKKVKPRARPKAAVAASDSRDTGGAVMTIPDPKGSALTGAQAAMAGDLYADMKDKVVNVRKDHEGAAVDTGGAGLEGKVLSETIGKYQKGFEECTAKELRRNPNFKGGKIEITITIGSSGTVTKALIDKADIDGSELGGCIKGRAKRIVFPRFEGDAFDTVIPLFLSGTG